MKKQKKEIKQNNTVSIPTKTKLFSDWKPCLVIVLFGFLLYSNSLKNDYALDDAIVLTQNQFTQKGFKGIPDIFKYDTFTGFWLTSNKDKTPDQIQKEKKLVAGGRYRPISLVSFAAEIELFGKQIKDDKNQVLYKGCPFVSHLNNLIFYILTCLLLYFVLKYFIDDKNNKKWYFSIAFITSILFIAHPIHTEAIANIKGRDEIFTLLFSLLAMWSTIRFVEKNKYYYLVLSSVFLFIALLSKEIAIAFLVIIPLSLYYFKKYPLKKIITISLPLLIATGLFLLLRASVLGMGGVEKQVVREIMNNPFLEANMADKFATIFYTLWIYIKLLFVPHPLTYDYYPYHISIIKWSNPAAFLPFILYLALGIYAVYGLVKKRDIWSYAIWIFLIPLSIVSNIFFPIGTFMNERFIFISSIGFCIVLAYFLLNTLAKLIKNESAYRYILSIFIFIILSLYSFKTISRNKDWKDDLTLFTTDVKVSYNSAKSTCSAGGKLLEEAQKEVNKANKPLHDSLCLASIGYLQQSISIYPEYTDAINLLGNAYFEYNFDIVKSIDAYIDVLKLFKFHGISYGNVKIVLGNAINLLNSKSTPNTPEEIISVCERLIAVQPEIGEAYHVMGTIYGRFLNNMELSIINLEKANTYNFDKTKGFHKDIGVAYGISGRYAEAITFLTKAIEDDPKDYQTYYNIGVTYQQLGDIKNANFYINKGHEIKQESQNNDKQ